MPAARATKKSARRSTPPSRKRKAQPNKHRRPAALAARTEAPEPPQLTDRDRVFVEHILFYQGDIERLLAMKPGPHSIFKPWSKQECDALLACEYIQQELERRRHLEELVNTQQAARMRATLARSQDLTPEFVKGALVESIEQSFGKDKVRALNVGLAVTGVMAKGELSTPPDKPAANVYRAIQTTTVQRVTETVTQTRELPETVRAPAEEPLTIEAKPAAASLVPPPDIEILDY